VGGLSGERIPPGYYTPETLPPLSEGARRILASVDAVPSSKGGAADENPGGLFVSDRPFAPIEASDRPLLGISIED